MKTKLISWVFFTIFFSFLTNSCNKDDNPEDTPLQELYIYTSSDEMLLSLDSIYSVLQRGEKVERIEFYGTVASGDAMVGGEPGGNDQPSMQNMMKFLVDPDNGFVSDYWLSMFEGVSLSNKFILNATESANSAGINEDIRSRAIGEAYFLKALFYYKLAIMYCGFPQMQSDYNNRLLGLPMIDEIFTADSITYERASLDDTWSAITEYLKKSIELLPERSEYSSDDIGRASKGAAKALLAKVYVFTEQWADGLQYAQEVINSGEYYLEGDDEHPGPYSVTRLTKEGNVTVDMAGYKWIWQPEANNCGETIFDVQHYANHSSWVLSEGNLIPQYYGVRSVLAYNSSEILEHTNYFWGFILPTTYYVETAFKDIGCEDAGGNILDPRFKISVVSEGDYMPYYYSDAYLRNKYSDSVLFDAWYNWPCTGYATWKYFTDPYYNEQCTNNNDHPQNTKFFRYADLLLIGAEAALKMGQTADALTWVNKVRERARNSGNTGYPQALNSVTPEDIWAERRVELAFEGHQLFDMIRTRRAEEILTHDAMDYATIFNPDYEYFGMQQFGDNFNLGKSEIMPIPQGAIDKSDGKLTQNPGY